MKQSVAAFLAQLRRMFARETLPAPPPEGLPRRARPRLSRLLLAAEPLSEEAPRGSPERRGLLRAVLGREPLPLDPPSAPRRRWRWLAWLFAPERLDGG
jgi:hypothetical protein